MGQQQLTGETQDAGRDEADHALGQRGTVVASPPHGFLTIVFVDGQARNRVSCDLFLYVISHSYSVFRCPVSLLFLLCSSLISGLSV